ncbi:hypothetical protein [Flavisphingomonas formosensis]|uniref:hypothetical protein n=1 Tax=Flavisphingomonas formosensis TaxID=861534 RepID=UPI0012F71DA2|nr:hypothetical protein [Sphingomonas formosensis]
MLDQHRRPWISAGVRNGAANAHLIAALRRCAERPRIEIRLFDERAEFAPRIERRRFEKDEPAADGFIEIEARPTSHPLPLIEEAGPQRTSARFTEGSSLSGSSSPRRK